MKSLRLRKLMAQHNKRKEQLELKNLSAVYQNFFQAVDVLVVLLKSTHHRKRWRCSFWRIGVSSSFFVVYSSLSLSSPNSSVWLNCSQLKEKKSSLTYITPFVFLSFFVAPSFSMSNLSVLPSSQLFFRSVSFSLTYSKWATRWRSIHLLPLHSLTFHLHSYPHKPRTSLFLELSRIVEL